MGRSLADTNAIDRPREPERDDARLRRRLPKSDRPERRSARPSSRARIRDLTWDLTWVHDAASEGNAKTTKAAQNAAFVVERMMGLEPTTFCMASDGEPLRPVADGFRPRVCVFGGTT